jgi:hypothetical protein
MHDEERAHRERKIAAYNANPLVCDCGYVIPYKERSQALLMEHICGKALCKECSKPYCIGE